MIRKRNLERIVIFTLIITFAFGMCSTFAVSKPGTPKITGLSGQAKTVTITWSKAKNASGYDVYQNGKKIARTTAKSYKSNITACGKYTYKVRAFKKYKVKQKQYYNKKKCKWQTKKIKKAKKRTVKVTKFRYGSYSKSKTISVYSMASIQSEMLAAINKERAKVGVKPLKLNSVLCNTSMDKSYDMYRYGDLSHDSPTFGDIASQLDIVGFDYLYCGENIAWGQQSVSEVMNDWMNSKGHKSNILDPNFELVGIGYYGGYWTQQFTDCVVDQAIVPDVEGMDLSAAEAAFNKAGFKAFSVKKEYSDDVPEGKVISQGPPAGCLFSTENVIELVVSLGSEPIETID